MNGFQNTNQAVEAADLSGHDLDLGKCQSSCGSQSTPFATTFRSSSTVRGRFPFGIRGRDGSRGRDKRRWYR